MKKFAFIFAALSFASSAQASSCVSSDIIGSWVMYQANLTARHTGRCAITVSESADRAFVGNCKFGTNSIDVQGTATVYSRCNVGVKMNFTGGSMYFEVQLASDKQAFVGSWKNTFGDVGTTSAVKQ